MTNLTDVFGNDLNTIITAIISAALISLTTVVLRVIFPRRSRLIYHQTKPSSVDLNHQFVQTETLFIQNIGRQEARDVCIIHNWQRDTFKAVLQPLHYKEEYTPAGQVVFKIDAIHPLETCVITYVHSTPPSTNEPILNSIRVSDHAARQVAPAIYHWYPSWVRWASKIFSFVGAWFILYLAIRSLIVAWHLIFA